MRASHVIRKQFSTTSRTAISLAQASPFKVFAYADVVAGSGVLWSQPFIREYGSSGWADAFINEWLKMPPVMRYTRGKVDVTIEWLGDVSWSSTLYEGGTHNP
jgi:hypothetical protein